ncbi:hypothetical protein RHA1_ro10451 (plasmid) [Rhodococcus jostii RHA1]|uniref:Uncharacterized protein n=1 Tax=Rhodococcus jostii (strain RHA1) TaxID=101510 RepID=Q0RVP6_RHOJR|nr:hypothetical protein RHA1_ro10451 [Rhodococcus jostii RHA1]
MRQCPRSAVCESALGTRDQQCARLRRIRGCGHRIGGCRPQILTGSADEESVVSCRAVDQRRDTAVKVPSLGCVGARQIPDQPGRDQRGDTAVEDVLAESEATRVHVFLGGLQQGAYHARCLLITGGQRRHPRDNLNQRLVTSRIPSIAVSGLRLSRRGQDPAQLVVPFASPPSEPRNAALVLQVRSSLFHQIGECRVVARRSQQFQAIMEPLRLL